MGAGGSTAASCSSLDLAYGNVEAGGGGVGRHYHHYHRRNNHLPQHHLREQQLHKYRAKSKVPHANDLLKSPGYLRQSTSYFDLTTSHLLDDRQPRDCNNNSNHHLSPTKLSNNWHPTNVEASAHLDEAYSLSNANIGASHPVMVLPCKPVSPALHLKKTNAGVANRILHQRQQQRYNELKKFSDSLPSLNNPLDPSLHQSVPHQSHHHHLNQHDQTNITSSNCSQDDHSSRLLSPTRHSIFNNSKQSSPIHHQHQHHHHHRHHRDQLAVTQAISSGAKSHQLHNNYNLVRNSSSSSNNNNNGELALHHDKHNHNQQQTAWQKAAVVAPSPINNCKSDYLMMKRATSMSSLHNPNQHSHLQYNHPYRPDSAVVTAACSRAGHMINHQKDTRSADSNKHLHQIGGNTKRYAPMRPDSLNSSSSGSGAGNHCLSSSHQFASRLNQCNKLQPLRQSSSPCNVRHHQRASPPNHHHHNQHQHHHHLQSSHNPPPPAPAASAMVKNVLKYRQQVSQGVQASKNRYKSKQQAQQQHHQPQQGCPVLPPLPRSQSLHELIQLRATENGQRMRTTGTLRGPLSGAEQGNNKVNLVAELLETRRQKKQQQDMDNAAGQAESSSATLLSQSSSTDDGIHDVSITADNNSTSDSSTKGGQLSANRQSGDGTAHDTHQVQMQTQSSSPSQSSSRHGGLFRKQQQPAMSSKSKAAADSRQRHSQNVSNGCDGQSSRSKQRDPLDCNGSTNTELDHHHHHHRQQSKSTLRRSQSHSALQQQAINNNSKQTRGVELDGDESDDLDELARFVYQFKQLNANKRAATSTTEIGASGGATTANKATASGANIGQQDSPNLQQSPNSTTSSSGFASSTCTSQSASSTSDGGLENLVNTRHQRQQSSVVVVDCDSNRATSSDPKRTSCSSSEIKRKKYPAPAPPSPAATRLDELANKSGGKTSQLEFPISGKLKLSSSLLSIVDEYQSSLQSRPHHHHNREGSRLTRPALPLAKDTANLTSSADHHHPGCGGGGGGQALTDENLHNHHYLDHNHHQHGQLEQLRKYTQLRQKSQSELALNHLTSTAFVDPPANRGRDHQLAGPQAPTASKVNLTTTGQARDDRPEIGRGSGSSNSKPYKSRLINLIRRISDKSEVIANGGGGGGGGRNGSGRSSSSAGLTGGGCESKSGSSVGGRSHHQIFRNSSACQMEAAATAASGGKAGSSSAGSKTAINQNAPVLLRPTAGYSDQTTTTTTATTSGAAGCELLRQQQQASFAKTELDLGKKLPSHASSSSSKSNEKASKLGGQASESFCDLNFDCDFELVKNCGSTSAASTPTAAIGEHNGDPKGAIKRAAQLANGHCSSASAAAPACDHISATKGGSMLDLVGQRCNKSTKLNGKKLANQHLKQQATSGSNPTSTTDGIRDNWRLAAPIASPCLVANAGCANIPSQTSYESSGKGQQQQQQHHHHHQQNHPSARLTSTNDNKQHKAVAKHQQNKSMVAAASVSCIATAAVDCSGGCDDVNYERQANEKSSQHHSASSANKATGRQQQQSPGLAKMKWSASSWLLSATGSGAKKSKLQKEQQQQQQQKGGGALGKSKSYLDRLLPSSGTSQCKGQSGQIIQNDIRNKILPAAAAAATPITTESEADQLLDELDQSLELVSQAGRYGAFTPVVSWWRQGARDDDDGSYTNHQHHHDGDEMMQQEKNIRLNALLSDSDEDDNDDADYASINQAMINETFDVNFAKSDEYLLSSKLSVGQPGSPSHSFTFSSPNTPIQSSPRAADGAAAANNDPNDFANQLQRSEGGLDSAASSGPRQSNTTTTTTTSNNHRTGLQANEFPSSSAMQQANVDSKACSSGNNNNNGTSDNNRQFVGEAETGRVVASSASASSSKHKPATSPSNVNNSTFTRISQARPCDGKDTSKIASIWTGKDPASCKAGRGGNSNHGGVGGGGNGDDDTLLTEGRGRQQASSADHHRSNDRPVVGQQQQQHRAKGRAFSVQHGNDAHLGAGGSRQTRNASAVRDNKVSKSVTSGQPSAGRCLELSSSTGVKGAGTTGGHGAEANCGSKPDDTRHQAGSKLRQIQGRSPCCSRRAAHCCCAEGEGVLLETPGSFKQQQFDASPACESNNCNPDKLQVNLANELTSGGCRCNNSNMEVDYETGRFHNKSHHCQLHQPKKDYQSSAAGEASLPAASGRRNPANSHSHCHDGVGSPPSPVAAAAAALEQCNGSHGCCCNVNSGGATAGVADNSHVHGNGGGGGGCVITGGLAREQGNHCWRKRNDADEDAEVVDNGDKAIVACGLACCCNGHLKSGEPNNKLIECWNCPCALENGLADDFAASERRPLVADNGSANGRGSGTKGTKLTEEPIKCVGAPVAPVAAAAAAVAVSAGSQAPEKKYPIATRGSKDNGNNVLVASSSSSSSPKSSAAPPTVVSSSRADEDNCFPAGKAAAAAAEIVGYYHYSHEKGKFAPAISKSNHGATAAAAAADVMLEGCRPTTATNKLQQATNHINGCAGKSDSCCDDNDTTAASNKHVKCSNHSAPKMVTCDHPMVPHATSGQLAAISNACVDCCAASSSSSAASAAGHLHNCCMNNRNIRCENPNNEMAVDANYPATTAVAKAASAKMPAACHHKHPSSEARLLENNNNNGSNDCLDGDVKEPTRASNRPLTSGPVNMRTGCNLVHGKLASGACCQASCAASSPSGPATGGSVHKEGNCCECHSSADNNNQPLASSINNTMQAGTGHQSRQANPSNCRSSACSADAAACINLSRYNPIKLTSEMNGSPAAVASKHHHYHHHDSNERTSRQAQKQRLQGSASSSSANQKHLGKEPLALFGRLRNSLLSSQKSSQVQSSSSEQQMAGHRLSAAQSQLSLLDYCNSANAPSYLKSNLMDINLSKQLDIFDDNFILKRKTPNAGLKSRC